MSHRKSKVAEASDRHAQALRQIQASVAENKKCFECEQRCPTYLDMTIGSFVCTKCSGMLRGINPPHRIKSVSMSSFSAEEVEFVRGKGNAYCAKVWLGLYDKSHGFAVDLKDDEAVKDFIIQKYEKNRYYVDPATIRHSPGSTASTISSDNLDSTGGLSASSSSNKKRLTGMIGTTIQMHNENTKRQANSTGLRGSQRSCASSLFQPPPAAPAASPQSNSKGRTSTSPSSADVLAELAVPPPAVDPFAQTTTSGDQASSFGKFSAPFPPPLKTRSFVDVAAPQSSGGGTFDGDNFANFDSVSFDGAALPPNPLSRPAPPPKKVSSNLMQPTNSLPQAVAKQPDNSGKDRYAALKDLDEIFKTAVIANDSPSVTLRSSTGTSIFGNSPTAAAAASPSATTKTPPLKNAPSSCGYTAFGGTGQASGPSPSVSTSNNWVAAWPPSSPSSASSSGTACPSSQTSINPFKGASNLSQLNTSPWPTTGTSPVQSTFPNWPLVDENGSKGFTTSTLEAGMDRVSTVGSNGSGEGTASFPDPFGAAHSSSSISQQSDPTDLFAKAPKPNLANDFETTDFFSTSSPFKTSWKTDHQDGGGGGGIDPWAAMTTASKQHQGDDLFTSKMLPAANPNNPFL